MKTPKEPTPVAPAVCANHAEAARIREAIGLPPMTAEEAAESLEETDAKALTACITRLREALKEQFADHWETYIAESQPNLGSGHFMSISQMICSLVELACTSSPVSEHGAVWKAAHPWFAPKLLPCAASDLGVMYQLCSQLPPGARATAVIVSLRLGTFSSSAGERMYKFLYASPDFYGDPLVRLASFTNIIARATIGCRGIFEAHPRSITPDEHAFASSAFLASLFERSAKKILEILAGLPDGPLSMKTVHLLLYFAKIFETFEVHSEAQQVPYSTWYGLIEDACEARAKANGVPRHHADAAIATEFRSFSATIMASTIKTSADLEDATTKTSADLEDATTTPPPVETIEKILLAMKANTSYDALLPETAIGERGVTSPLHRRGSVMFWPTCAVGGTAAEIIEEAWSSFLPHGTILLPPCPEQQSQPQALPVLGDAMDFDAAPQSHDVQVSGAAQTFPAAGAGANFPELDLAHDFLDFELPHEFQSTNPPDTPFMQSVRQIVRDDSAYPIVASLLSDSAMREKLEALQPPQLESILRLFSSCIHDPHMCIPYEYNAACMDTLCILQKLGILLDDGGLVHVFDYPASIREFSWVVVLLGDRDAWGTHVDSASDPHSENRTEALEVLYSALSLLHMRDVAGVIVAASKKSPDALRTATEWHWHISVDMSTRTQQERTRGTPASLRMFDAYFAFWAILDAGLMSYETFYGQYIADQFRAFLAICLAVDRLVPIRPAMHDLQSGYYNWAWTLCRSGGFNLEWIVKHLPAVLTAIGQGLATLSFTNKRNPKVLDAFAQTRISAQKKLKNDSADTQQKFDGMVLTACRLFRRWLGGKQKKLPHMTLMLKLLCQIIPTRDSPQAFATIYETLYTVQFSDGSTQDMSLFNGVFTRFESMPVNTAAQKKQANKELQTVLTLLCTPNGTVEDRFHAYLQENPPVAPPAALSATLPHLESHQASPAAVPLPARPRKRTQQYEEAAAAAPSPPHRHHHHQLALRKASHATPARNVEAHRNGADGDDGRPPRRKFAASEGAQADYMAIKELASVPWAPATERISKSIIPPTVHVYFRYDPESGFWNGDGPTEASLKVFKEHMAKRYDMNYMSYVQPRNMEFYMATYVLFVAKTKTLSLATCDNIMNRASHDAPYKKLSVILSDGLKIRSAHDASHFTVGSGAKNKLFLQIYTFMLPTPTTPALLFVAILGNACFTADKTPQDFLISCTTHTMYLTEVDLAHMSSPEESLEQAAEVSQRIITEMQVFVCKFHDSLSVTPLGEAAGFASRFETARDHLSDAVFTPRASQTEKDPSEFGNDDSGEEHTPEPLPHSAFSCMGGEILFHECSSLRHVSVKDPAAFLPTLVSALKSGILEDAAASKLLKQSFHTPAGTDRTASHIENMSHALFNGTTTFVVAAQTLWAYRLGTTPGPSQIMTLSGTDLVFDNTDRPCNKVVWPSYLSGMFMHYFRRGSTGMAAAANKEIAVGAQKGAMLKLKMQETQVMMRSILCSSFAAVQAVGMAASDIYDNPKSLPLAQVADHLSTTYCQTIDALTSAAKKSGNDLSALEWQPGEDHAQG